MIQTVEAIIDESGLVKVLNNLRLPRGRRAIVTVLDEKAEPLSSETTQLSEESLTADWLRSEEDEAWSHLQSEK